MKRTNILFAVAMLIVLSACGGSNDNPNTPAPAPGPVVPAPTPTIPTVGGCAIPLGGGQPLTQNGQPIYAQLISQSGGFGGIPSSDSLTLQVYRQTNNSPYGYQQYVNVVAAGQYQVSNPGMFASPYGQGGIGYPYPQTPVAPQTVCVSSQSWGYAMVSGPWAQLQNLYLTGTVSVPSYNYNPYSPPQQTTYPMPITMVINGAIDLYSSRLQGSVIVQTQQGAGIQYQAR